MMSGFVIIAMYALFWMWFFGGFAPTKKPPAKKKSPEQELAEALGKYLATLKKPGDAK
jgi:succinate-acetate transporter protein